MSTHPLAILIPKDPPKPKLKPKGGPHPMLGINLNRKPTGQSVPYYKLMMAIGPIFLLGAWGEGQAGPEEKEKLFLFY